MKRQNKTILIVEDDPNDQLFIKRAFHKIGVTDILQILPNGLEAIHYLNGEGKYSDRNQFQFPSIIMTDLKMPMADGFAVVKHLKGNPEWAVIPTVVLSASGDTDDIKKAYVSGANSYLIKPGGPAELESLLKHFYDYWIRVEVPQVDPHGTMAETVSRGKLGERH